VRYRAALRSDWEKALEHQGFAGKGKMTDPMQKPEKAELVGNLALKPPLKSPRDVPKLFQA